MCLYVLLICHCNGTNFGDGITIKKPSLKKDGIILNKPTKIDRCLLLRYVFNLVFDFGFYFCCHTRVIE